MYDVNSKHAEDFINHEEILETLAYADENKDNLELVESLINKAALRKGLSHREASVLLACQDAAMNEKIDVYKRQRQYLLLFLRLLKLCLRKFFSQFLALGKQREYNARHQACYKNEYCKEYK